MFFVLLDLILLKHDVRVRVRNGLMKSLGAKGRVPSHEPRVVLVPANMQHFTKVSFLGRDFMKLGVNKSGF